MRFEVVTIFPDLFNSFLSESLMAKAIEKRLIEVRLSSPRNFTADRHQTADDRPYGGGPGMVLKPEPVAAAIEAAGQGPGRPWRVYLSPSGDRLTQARVRELSRMESLVLICGRYEGLDQRVIDLLVDEEISIGDYVVNGGEVPAMVLMEAVARLRPGFMGKSESADEESHQRGLLEYPHYTRPPEFRGFKVPDVLLSGNHKDVDQWRLSRSLAKTLDRRPEMLAGADLSAEALKALANLNKPEPPCSKPRSSKSGGGK